MLVIDSFFKLTAFGFNGSVCTLAPFYSLTVLQSTFTLVGIAGSIGLVRSRAFEDFPVPFIAQGGVMGVMGVRLNRSVFALAPF